MNNCDILLLQEQCLFESQLCKLSKLGINLCVTGKSSTDENVALEGRLYGGCAIMRKSSLRASTEDLKSSHVRLSSAMMKLKHDCDIVLKCLHAM